QFHPLIPGFFCFTHGYPNVGVEEIGAQHTLFHIFGQGDASAGFFGDQAALGNQILFRPEGFRSDQANIHTHLGGTDHQGVAHVVAGITQVGELDLIQTFALAVLQHGHEVSQDLGRVEFVGQAVPDRHTGMGAQLFHDLLTVATVFDAVIHAPQYTGGVLHGLLVTDLGTAWAEVRNLSALVEGRHFKRTAGAGGGLLEDQGDVLAGQVFALIATVFGFFQVDGEIDHVLDFAWGEVQQFQEVTVTQIKSHDEFSLYICSDQIGSSVGYAFTVQICSSHIRVRYWLHTHGASGDDIGTRLSLEDGQTIFQRADPDHAASRFDKFTGRLNLGPHGTGIELDTSQFIRAGDSQRMLGRLAPIQV